MKRFYLFCIMACMSAAIYAQATSLVIDNQTPGWLSSKINYGDQLTVRNLKVTGYINLSDYKFIGTLIQNRNLRGKLDLSEANTVAEESGEQDNTLKHNPFGLSLTSNITLQYFIFPKSTVSINRFGFGELKFSIDTLVIDTQMKTFDRDILECTCNHLILGENFTVFKSSYDKFYSIDLPNTLKKISSSAFSNRMEDLQNVNFIRQKCFPNLEEIGMGAFQQISQYGSVDNHRQTLPDTLRFPAIKNFHVQSFDYKDGMHIFLGSNLEVFDNSVQVGFSNSINNSVYFHINNTEGVAIASNVGKCNICIPKGSLSAWKAKCSSRYVNFIEEETTEISNTRILQRNKTDHIYSVNGNCISNQTSGLHKGIYIIKGKKYIKK